MEANAEAVSFRPALRRPCARPGSLRPALALAACMCALALALLAPSNPAAAESVSGRAFVGGSWMVGGQSYFSVSILGHSTVGWCMNHGAAEPLSGWYGFTATRTVSGDGGSTDLWLEGSFEPVIHDAGRDVSRTQAVTFRAGTPNAFWDVTAPSGCTLLVDGARHAPGSPVRVLPGQRVSLEASDPASLGGEAGTVTLEGTAQANASTTETYRDIVITPPGAWDGHSYANGLPAGYQRVGIGPIVVERPRAATALLGAAARMAVTVRYFADGQTDPVYRERVPARSLFTPSPEADEAARRPDCTPGLDAWYHDRAYRTPVVPFVITADADLHGRNLATVSYAPSPASGLQFETDARTAPDRDAQRAPLSSLLPGPRVVAWGTVAALEPMPDDALYAHDGTRWRTLRRPSDGWHLLETALDEPVSSARIERDLTVYDYWTKSTYDGVLDW